MSYSSAEKAEIVGETTRSFRGREFAIFSKLVAQVRSLLFGVVVRRAGIVRGRGFFVMLILVVLV